MKLISVLLITLAVGVGAAPAAFADHCGAGVSEEVCVEGQGAGFTVESTNNQGGSQNNGGSKGTSNAGGYTGPPTETRYAPTCTGNSAFDMGVLCNAALTCPAEDEVKFWMWQRQKINGEWTGWNLVDTVCLGPDEPAINPAVAIPAIVQRDFQSVVVLKGAADVSPKPETLVNVVTKFRTDAPSSYTIPLRILGQSVVITAKAEKHTWHFGDGQTATSYEPGGYAEHTYARATTEQAYVGITWSGSFTVNDGASQPINGTVSTTGDPVDVIVREARSELVRD